MYFFFDADGICIECYLYYGYTIEPLPGVDIPDHVKCYTDQVPRSEKDMSISSLHIGGKLVQGDRDTDALVTGTWGTMVQEMLTQKDNMLVNMRPKGREDLKYFVHGNKDSGPISFLLNINPQGHKGHVSDNSNVDSVSSIMY